MAPTSSGKSLVEEFFLGYENKFGPLEAVRTPETPVPMIIGPVLDSPGWIYWRLYPWSTNRDIFQDVERNTGLQFPQAFKNFLTTFHTLRLDLGFVRFPETPIGYEEAKLRELLFEGEQASHALSDGLLPFAWDGRDDYGLLCFDRRESWSGDVNVICLRAFDRSFAHEPVASSFERYLRACTVFLESGLDFLGLSEFATATDAERIKSFEVFLSTDPEVMGRQGRNYWSQLARLG